MQKFKVGDRVFVNKEIGKHLDVGWTPWGVGVIKYLNMVSGEPNPVATIYFEEPFDAFVCSTYWIRHAMPPSPLFNKAPRKILLTKSEEEQARDKVKKDMQAACTHEMDLTYAICHKCGITLEEALSQVHKVQRERG